MRIFGFIGQTLGFVVLYILLVFGMLLAIDSFIPRSNPVEFGFLLVQLMIGVSISLFAYFIIRKIRRM